MESGKDLTEGGAKYNGTGPQASGMATCADELSTIKQLVFDEKKVTGAELLQAVRDNWEGHEKLYALVNSSKVHHYGNDDDYFQMFYGASSQQGYEKLFDSIGDIGDEM